MEEAKTSEAVVSFIRIVAHVGRLIPSVRQCRLSERKMRWILSQIVCEVFLYSARSAGTTHLDLLHHFKLVHRRHFLDLRFAKGVGEVCR